MTRTLYDVKRVVYQTVDIADYFAAVNLSGMKEILANATLTIDTKGESATQKRLNSTKYVDDETITVRKKGNFTFERNVDTNFLTSHSDLINAGVGEVNSGTGGNVTVTAGVGSVATPFLTTSTTNVVANMLIFIPSYGLRKIVSVVANTSFVVDRPIDTAISTSTTFISKKSINLSNPKATTTKAFNFAIETDDGALIILMGCVPSIKMELTQEAQLKATFTITSPEIYESSSSLTNVTEEAFAEPVICNFSSSYFINSDGTVDEEYPQMMTLNLAGALEENKYNGGRNNIRGYNIRASIKPKMSFDRDATALALLAAPRTEVGYSAYQTNFGIYFQSVTFFNINSSEANGNHDSISAELNVNTKASANVYIFLP